MPGILKVKDLEERKKALARESDLYRETLKIEIHNLQIYALRTRDRFTSVRRWHPLLTLFGPFAFSFLRRRSFPKVRLLTAVLFAWKVFKKLRAVLPGVFRRRPEASHSVRERTADPEKIG